MNMFNPENLSDILSTALISKPAGYRTASRYPSDSMETIPAHIAAVHIGTSRIFVSGEIIEVSSK